MVVALALPCRVAAENDGAAALAEGWVARSLSGLPGDGGVEATVVRDTVTGDSVALFRFVPGRLMFYSPFKENAANIRAVVRLIERHRKAIEAGQAVVRVRGFCDSFGSEQANRRAAKNRSNQVKSWFISHHGMREEWYRTTNSTGTWQGIGNVVAVVDVWYLEREARRDTVAVMPSVPGKAETVPAVAEVPGPAAPAERVKPEPVPPVERVRVPPAERTTLL